MADDASACTPFPERVPVPLIVYIADVILVPVLFGLGLCGGLLSFIVLNRSNLRKESAVYVYLAGLTVLDIVSLLAVVPKTMQDTELADPEVTYSRWMAFLITKSYGISNISKHSAAWIMVFLPIISLQCSRSPFRKDRWTKISTSRIVVFLIILFCTVIDFPRFLEVAVTRIEGHCFENMEIWYWKYTEFGSTNLFIIVFPMMIVIVCFGIPFVLILIFTSMLWSHLRSKPKQKKVLYTPKNPDQVIHQASSLVLIVVVVFSALQLPDAIVQIFVALYGLPFSLTPGFHEFAAVSRLLVLIRCSINFLLYCLLSSEFRKAFSRTFCCLCIKDEYYEPITCKTVFCCGPDIDPPEKKLKEKKSLFSIGKKEKKKKSSGWV